MTGPATMTIGEFIDQVGQACADLPEQQHRQVLAALQAHLAEHADDHNPVRGLGHPLDYVQELQRALAHGSPAPRQWKTAAGACAVVLLLVAVVITLLVKSESGHGRPAAAVSPPPGIVPTGVVEGTIVLGQQPPSTQTGTGVVCVVPQSGENAQVCDAVHSAFRLAVLPGVYSVTATFYPAALAPITSTGPNTPKAVPCTLTSSLATVTVDSDTHIDIACQLN